MKEQVIGVSETPVAKLTADEQNRLNVKVLAIQNLDLQGKLLHRDLENLAKQMTTLQEELKRESEEIFGRYGMTVGKDRIGPDGVFVRGT